MPKQKFNDIDLDGRQFRIGLISALNADWIINQILLKRYADPEVFARCQDLLLSAVSVYRQKDGEQPIPAQIYAGGRFLCPDLELDADVDLVHQLYEAAVEFNITPFFAKRVNPSPDPTPATTQ